MGRVTRDLILANKAEVLWESIDVPQFGGEVWIRGLSGKERDKFEATTIIQKKNGIVRNLQNVRARLLVLVLTAEKDGKLLFTPDDADELGELPGKLLAPLFEIAQNLSGFGDDDMKELADGLGEGQSADSGSV